MKNAIPTELWRTPIGRMQSWEVKDGILHLKIRSPGDDSSTTVKVVISEVVDGQ